MQSPFTPGTSYWSSFTVVPKDDLMYIFVCLQVHFVIIFSIFNISLHSPFRIHDNSIYFFYLSRRVLLDVNCLLNFGMIYVNNFIGGKLIQTRDAHIMFKRPILTCTTLNENGNIASPLCDKENHVPGQGICFTNFIPSIYVRTIGTWWNHNMC